MKLSKTVTMTNLQKISEKKSYSSYSISSVYSREPEIAIKIILKINLKTGRINKVINMTDEL